MNEWDAVSDIASDDEWDKVSNVATTDEWNSVSEPEQPQQPTGSISTTPRVVFPRNAAERPYSVGGGVGEEIEPLEVTPLSKDEMRTAGLPTGEPTPILSEIKRLPQTIAAGTHGAIGAGQRYLAGQKEKVAKGYILSTGFPEVAEKRKKEAGELREAAKVHGQAAEILDPMWYKTGRIQEKLDAIRDQDPDLVNSFKMGNISGATQMLVFDAYLRGDQNAKDQAIQLSNDVGQVGYERHEKSKEKKGILGKAENVLNATSEMLPMMATGAAIGTIPVVGPVLATSMWAKQGAGEIITALKNEGVPDDVALAYGILGGIPYALVERLQVGQALNIGAKKAIGDNIKQNLLRIVKEKGLDFIKQNAEEVAQSLIEETAINAAVKSTGVKTDPKKVWNDYLDIAGSTLKESVGPMGVLTLLGLGTGAGRVGLNGRTQEQPPAPEVPGAPGEITLDQYNTLPPEQKNATNFKKLSISDQRKAVQQQKEQPQPPPGAVGPITEVPSAEGTGAKAGEAGRQEGADREAPGRVYLRHHEGAGVEAGAGKEVERSGLKLLYNLAQGGSDKGEVAVTTARYALKKSGIDWQKPLEGQEDLFLYGGKKSEAAKPVKGPIERPREAPTEATIEIGDPLNFVLGKLGVKTPEEFNALDDTEQSRRFKTVDDISRGNTADARIAASGIVELNDRLDRIEQPTAPQKPQDYTGKTVLFKGLPKKYKGRDVTKIFEGRVVSQTGTEATIERTIDDKPQHWTVPLDRITDVEGAETEKPVEAPARPVEAERPAEWERYVTRLDPKVVASGPKLAAKIPGLRFDREAPGFKDVKATLQFTDTYTGDTFQWNPETGFKGLQARHQEKRNARSPEEQAQAIAKGVGNLEYVGKKQVIGQARGMGRYETDYVYHFKTSEGQQISIKPTDTVEGIKSYIERTKLPEKEATVERPPVPIEAKPEPLPQVEPPKEKPVQKLQTRALDAILNRYIKKGETDYDTAKRLHADVISILGRAKPIDIAEASGITEDEANVAIADIRAGKSTDATQKVRQAIAPRLLYGQGTEEVLAEITEPRTASGEVMFAKRRDSDEINKLKKELKKVEQRDLDELRSGRNEMSLDEFNNKWEEKGEEARKIRMRLYELTGDYYGRSKEYEKKKKAKKEKVEKEKRSILLQLTTPQDGYKDVEIVDYPSRGYLLPDGDYLSIGTNDHRYINGMVEYPNEDETSYGYRTDKMNRIMRDANIIRFIPESGTFDIEGDPTSEQIQAIKDYAYEHGKVQVGFKNGKSNIYTSDEIDEIDDDIERGGVMFAKREGPPSIKDVYGWERKNYIGPKGNVVKSSREHPMQEYPWKVGQWRVDDWEGSYGKPVEQLREINVDDIELSEDDYTKVNYEGRGDDAERYAQWSREGKKIPPISAIEMDNGRIKVSDGHRRIAAAKMAGEKTILAWVSPKMDTGKKDSGGNPIYTAMTDRDEYYKNDIERGEVMFAKKEFEISPERSERLNRMVRQSIEGTTRPGTAKVIQPEDEEIVTEEAAPGITVARNVRKPYIKGEEGQYGKDQLSEQDHGSEEENRLVKAVYQAAKKEPHYGTIRILEGTPTQRRLAKDISAITDDPVKIIETDSQKLIDTLGFDFDGFRYKGTIYIDVNSRRPFLWTAYHEWWHGLSREQKDFVIEAAELTDEGAKKRLASGNEEFFADIAGEVMGRPETIRHMAKQDAGMLKSIVDDLLDVLNSVVDRVKKLIFGSEETRPQYERYLKNVEQVRDRLISVMEGGSEEGIQFAERRPEFAINPISVPQKVDPFFSPLLKAVQNLKQQKGNGEQFFNMLTKTPGVKEAEWKWMGLDDFLKGKQSVTRQEIEEFVRQNQVRVEEVEKKGPGFEGRSARMQVLIDKENAGIITDEEKDELDILEQEVRRGEEGVNETKYSQYTLPGASNYREVLLTLPNPSSKMEWRKTNGGYSWFVGDTQVGSIVQSEKRKQDALGTISNSERDIGKRKDFTSSHWDEPNVIAHIRMNDREVNGEKVLFIEEIQSDWSRQAREAGVEEKYKREELNVLPKEDQDVFGEFERKNMWLIEAPGQIYQIPKSKYDTAEDAIQYVLREKKKKSGVPAQPFLKNWEELTLKRVLRMAAEEGYDRLSWISGAQTADRYDLSKQVDGIEWNPYSNGGKSIIIKGLKGISGQDIEVATNKEGVVTVTDIGAPKDWEGKKISDILGKGISDRILSEENGEMKGEGLRVGGEWSSALYDRMIPKFYEKYLKKWKTKVESVDLSDNVYVVDKNGKEVWQGDKDNVPQLDEGDKIIGTMTQQSIPITPEMASSVLYEGQPMFAKRDRDEDSFGVYLDAVDSAIAKTINRLYSKEKSIVIQPVSIVRIKKIWNDYSKTGVVSDENALYDIGRDIVDNIAQLDANTTLTGHSGVDPKNIIEEHGKKYDEKEYDELLDKLTIDGAYQISDYGLPRLQKIAVEILSAETAEERLLAIDKALNVIHQRSDLSKMLIEGGRQALDQLSEIDRDIRFAKRVTEADLPALYEEAKTFNKRKSAKEIAKHYANKRQSSMARWALRTTAGRLLDISQVIRDQMQKHVSGVMVDTATALRKAKPFLDKIKAMPREAYQIFDLAAKEADSDKINELAKEHGFEKELAAYRDLMDGLIARLMRAGYDTGYLKDYFPRMSKDRDAYRNFIRGTPEWGSIDEAIREKERKINRPMTDEEQEEFLDLYIRGYGDKMNAGKPGSLKERRVKLIDNEMNSLLEDTMIAIPAYIDRMIKKAARKELFDPEAKNTEIELNNIDDSIGEYVARLIREKKLNPAKQDELVGLLRSYFNFKPTDRAAALIKNAGYATTMGSGFSSTFSQMADAAFGFYTTGLGEIPAVAKALFGKTSLTVKDLGIDDVAGEFRDPGKMAKAVDVLFKGVGIKYGDSLFKNAFIEANLKQFQRMAKSGKISKDMRSDLKNIFGDEADSVIADLAAGDNTDNVKLLMLNQISKFQPVTLLQVPQAYLDAPRGRIMYALKTYQINQLNAIIDEAKRGMTTATNKKDFADAARRVATVVAYLVACGIGVDALKDFIFRRKASFGEYLTDNVLKLALVSRYTTWKMRTDGWKSTALNMIAPQISWLDYIGKDFEKFRKAATTPGPDDVALKNLETIRALPVVGQEFYWWGGGGRESVQRREAYKAIPNEFRREVRQQREWIKKFQLAGDTASAEKYAKKLKEYAAEKGPNVKKYFDEALEKSYPASFKGIYELQQSDKKIDAARAKIRIGKLTPGQKALYGKYVAEKKVVEVSEK